MATYKVLQDIEAEDKFLGPLTLRQFIYGAITGLCLYLSFFSLSRGMKFALVIFLPIAVATGILAWPWSGQQTTEVWLLAKLRFHLKPRRRLWDQSGMKDLVTITAPKHDEKTYTNNLSQTEVKSRLQALAQTIDSRGWAIKNVNSFAPTSPRSVQQGDRLISFENMPVEVPGFDLPGGSDVLDEQNPTAQRMGKLMEDSDREHKEDVMKQMELARASSDSPEAEGPWFTQDSATSVPANYGPYPAQQNSNGLTDEERAVLDRVHQQEKLMKEAFGHKSEKPPAGETSLRLPHETGKQAVRPQPKPNPNPVILDDVKQSAGQSASSNTNSDKPPKDDEVVVSLR